MQTKRTQCYKIKWKGEGSSSFYSLCFLLVLQKAFSNTDVVCYCLVISILTTVSPGSSRDTRGLKHVIAFLGLRVPRMGEPLATHFAYLGELSIQKSAIAALLLD